MATAARPRDPFRSPMAEAMRAQARRAIDAGPAEPELSAPVLRLACVVLAGTFAFSQWLALLDHRPPGAVIRAFLVAAAFGAALVYAGRRSSAPRRAAAIATTVVGALMLGLVVARVPASDLDPRSWGKVVTGLGNGLSALPGLTVPYRLSDPWARVILVLGGVLLLLLAVAAAVWPRRPAPGSRMTAIAALGVMYAVPAIELSDPHPFRQGAAFTLVLAAVLYAERLRPRQAPWAVASVLALVVAGLILAPRLDASAPLIDLQKLATNLDDANALTFNWDHRYGPLSWPRKGRTVARVDAKIGDYWKAETLEEFNGVDWVAAPPSGQPGPADPTPVTRWRQEITVSIGDMKTRQFLGAGTTTYIWKAPHRPIAATAGSYVSDSRPLVRGDAYRARVYYPRPSEAQMSRARVGYAGDARDLTISVPLSLRHGGAADVRFDEWGKGDGVPAARAAGAARFDGDGARALAASPYARVYALAQRLRARSRTAYDYIVAVERHLQNGFVYDETPPRTRYPLATFLLSDPRGYCQHFSGAMTLLLRMGGIPARVATGFSPGTPASASGEFVVRDQDAHSWVEILFRGIGWVTFDPTPQVAPAASQISDPVSGAAPNALIDRPRPAGRPAEQGSKLRSGAGGGGGGGTWWRTPLIVLAAVLLVGGLAAAAIALRVERRRHPPTAPELAELERALRRTGRDPRPPTTLLDLERLLGPDERTAGYLRAISGARYDQEGPGPTEDQRSALRRALGDGLGMRGRLRALWGLPPRPRARGRALH
jgi:transglutaminase-like putative cysteine protease